MANGYPVIVEWEDLRFPATAINPPGQASDPDVDTTYGTLLFAASGTEMIFVLAQLPHSWQEGSDLHPHIHWAKTTSASGNVMWELQYRWSKIGEVMDSSWTTLTKATTTVSDGDTAEQHAITAFDAISGTGCSVSDMLVMKVSRLGDDAADTYGADARLLEFDIHLQIDSRGSLAEYTK